jgi:hypothetical protein
MELAALVQRPDGKPTERPVWAEQPPRPHNERIVPRDLALATRLPNGGWSLRGEPPEAPIRQQIDPHAHDDERLVELEALVSSGFAGRRWIQERGEKWTDTLREAARSVIGGRAQILSELTERDKRLIAAFERGDFRAPY